jgi:hypothetical protein
MGLHGATVRYRTKSRFCDQDHAADAPAKNIFKTFLYFRLDTLQEK